MRTGILVTCLTGFLAAPAVAQEATSMARLSVPDDKQKPWSGSAALGYADVSGNTDTSALNFKGEVRYDQARWHHILAGTAITASEEESTTTEAYWAGYKAQYDFAARYYVFGGLDWYKDRFSAYDHQIYETAGVGWRALTGPNHLLDLEIGGGFRQSELQNGEDQDEAVGVLRGIYSWNISETATFSQRLGVLSGSDNTYMESVTELRAGIIGNLAMVLGYTVKRNSDVEPDTSVTPPETPKKTDRYTTVSLEYKF